MEFQYREMFFISCIFMIVDEFLNNKGIKTHLLFSPLSFFFLSMCVHSYVLDCKSEGEWLLYSKEIILVTDMDLFNFELHSSEETGE